MKQIFDDISVEMSKKVTNSYSTSFSLGINFLGKKLRNPIHCIYGYVRFADEIVDSFHGFDKAKLLQEFKADTIKAIEEKISLNPILNSFQRVVHRYNIDWDLIEKFLDSMEMDLHKTIYDKAKYDNYIVGSAEVVGLMCLKVFTNGDTKVYNELKPYAMSLGSAFQKINFLRDIKADYQELGRSYFPDIDLDRFSKEDKLKIEMDIRHDFDVALIGIKKLPMEARKGVYLAYIYYVRLFQKIQGVPANMLLNRRIRIPNFQKISLMFYSLMRHQLNIL